MALSQLTAAQSVNEFELQVFELAYLLSFMGVETVVGLPDAVLFPKDSNLRKKVLRAGENSLVEKGYLVPTPPRGAAYNDDLLSMTAAIADPRIVIVARRETCGGERANALIFANNVEVVELIQTDRQIFRLRRFSELSEAFQQIRKMLGVPARSRNAGVVAELRIEAFEQIRKLIANHEVGDAVTNLTAAGLSEEWATRFSQTLEQPDRKGTVSVLKLTSQKVSAVRVIGFYHRDGETWITSVVNEAAHLVRTEGVDSEGFLCRLVDRVASVGS